MSLNARPHLTKRAPDAGESAHIPSSFTRLIIFLAGRLRRPRPSAGNANRWAAVVGKYLQIKSNSTINKVTTAKNGQFNMLKIQKFFLLISVFLLLSGCAKELNQQEAIDIAVKIVSNSEPEISGSQVSPSNIVAEKMTVNELVKRLDWKQPHNVLSDISPCLWMVSGFQPTLQT